LRASCQSKIRLRTLARCAFLALAFLAVRNVIAVEPSPSVSTAAAIPTLPPLRVSPDGRGFTRAGKPFYWLADTAWGAATQSHRAIDDYLSNVAAIGFNVVQGPIPLRRRKDVAFPIPTAGIQWLRVRESAPPLLSLDPIELNAEYFAGLDYFIKRATELGLYVALPILWGPTLDTLFANPAQAREFASAVVQRYSGYSNLIWLVAGEYHKLAWDKSPRDRVLLSPAELAQLKELGALVRRLAHPDNLISLHPDGGRSSGEDFHAESWFDFSMLQSFSSNLWNIQQTAADRLRSPFKPSVQGELFYEGGNAGQLTDWHVRLAGYSGLCAGSAGFSYGHQSVWRFADDWRDALGAPGRVQIGRYLREFVTGLSLTRLQPSNEIILAGPVVPQEQAQRLVCAATDPAANVTIVYTSKGDSFKLRGTDQAESGRWFNPRKGTYSPALGKLTAGGVVYAPPTESGDGEDWVLVLG